MIGRNDIRARVGGDELIILGIMEPYPLGAAELANQIIASIAEPFIIEGRLVHIGASIGIAAYTAADGDVEAMADCAEIALARAKAEGGGRCCMFEADMRRLQLEQMQLERDFREAIEKRQFIIHYQPLFECDTFELCGFEAVLRWQHPTRGMVSPVEFIPFAEKSGLIKILGLWVLETACREAATWPDCLRVSVNLSPVQLRAANLIDSIQAALGTACLCTGWSSK